MTIELVDDGGVLRVNDSALACPYKPQTQPTPMLCKHCDVPVITCPFPMLPGQAKPSGVCWVHDFGNGVLRVMATQGNWHNAEPRTHSLYIYVPSTRSWERHESATVAMRDYLRAIWQSAGCATAVVR